MSFFIYKIAYVYYIKKMKILEINTYRDGGSTIITYTDFEREDYVIIDTRFHTLRDPQTNFNELKFCGDYFNSTNPQVINDVDFILTLLRSLSIYSRVYSRFDEVKPIFNVTINWTEFWSKHSMSDKEQKAMDKELLKRFYSETL